MSDNLSHKGRVVLVTGGAGGIGAAIVEQYVRKGAAVAIVDRSRSDGLAFAVKALESRVQSAL